MQQVRQFARLGKATLQGHGCRFAYKYKCLLGQECTYLYLFVLLHALHISRQHYVESITQTALDCYFGKCGTILLAITVPSFDRSTHCCNQEWLILWSI